ncbi:hypothetical protein [Phocaeicola coprophilus]|uniref:hypothetical protein n=1 Tax=Phocaeicola coprophilus TaxID=387090 RepID=UPI00255D11DF|nr:hypothetical protein [Phocaeicola coprophilus]
MINLQNNEVFGLIKTNIDVHTLGITTIYHLLKDCGYECYIAPDEISKAIEQIHKLNNFSLLQKWINENHITRIGFSYRLDPHEAKDYFCHLFYEIQSHNLFTENGGFIRSIFFAGLPDACRLIKQELGDKIIVFPGDETPIESLKMLGVPEYKLPNSLKETSEYDNMRWEFAEKLISNESYKYFLPYNHLSYPEAGTQKDSFIKRLLFCKSQHNLPLIRVHVGPYNSNRSEAIKEFISWEKILAGSKLLDILSIGSSQLTQSKFGENWDGLPNGGGVPINSEQEYLMVKEAAKPMLVRTYAGTKNICDMAEMHERCLNISWHALSFWWFCEIDGRGENSVLENLREHLKTIKYIATTGKPLEPNVPHHFAFRGADDITYIISGFLAAKTAKSLGIKDLILQNMLNTPKYTIGIQDLAKGRTMLKLIRELEDEKFSVHLQLRAGLDYFSPNLEKAKVQLAAVTALMDDIEPNNENSPEIVHVVSYSEAVRLATPPIIQESIKITLSALKEYRELRKKGIIENMAYNKEVKDRCEDMYQEAKESILLLEKHIPNLYTAEGLYQVFKEGFFPVPYMLDPHNKYPEATHWHTAIKNGGIKVVDEQGNIIRTTDRYKKIISHYE